MRRPDGIEEWFCVVVVIYGTVGGIWLLGWPQGFHKYCWAAPLALCAVLSVWLIGIEVRHYLKNRKNRS